MPGLQLLWQYLEEFSKFNSISVHCFANCQGPSHRKTHLYYYIYNVRFHLWFTVCDRTIVKKMSRAAFTKMDQANSETSNRLEVAQHSLAATYCILNGPIFLQLQSAQTGSLHQKWSTTCWNLPGTSLFSLQHLIKHKSQFSPLPHCSLHIIIFKTTN